jgi:hypothetical protein
MMKSKAILIIKAVGEEDPRRSPTPTAHCHNDGSPLYGQVCRIVLVILGGEFGSFISIQDLNSVMMMDQPLNKRGLSMLGRPGDPR